MAEDEEQRSYLEKKLDAKITYESDKIEFVFQRAKVKMTDELEIELIKTAHPDLHKDISLTEDQVIVTYHLPKSYAQFKDIYQHNIQSRWQFAYNVLQLIRSHSLPRMKLVVSPSNIVYDQGLVPRFLHYGVSESLPPYEQDEELLWLETKAIIAVIADEKHDFSTYLSHYTTKEMPAIPKSIMQAESYEEIIDIIEENMKKNDAYEQTVIHIPTKKWKLRRYIIWVLTILLIPSIAYSVFALFFKIPESNAYVESNLHYQKEEYSAVIDSLDAFNHEKMPRIVQFELASSYIVHESLTEEQRQNIEKNMTLQADRKYYLYWIDIGRGNYQEAVDTARRLEERDLIVFGLLKQREDVKADKGLDSSERQDELKKIQQEIDEYQNEMEEEQREAEEEAAEKEKEQNDEQDEKDDKDKGKKKNKKKDKKE